MEDHPTDDSAEFGDAERELQDFRNEFQRVVDDLPAQRVIKDIDQLLKTVDELAGRTVDFGNLPDDEKSAD